MKKNRTRKEWVKNLLIVFLAVMLVLTFCSNTIMNMYLPEVQTEAVRAGKIQDSIRGSGVVELNQAYQIKLPSVRTIKTVLVKNGQEVKVGDVLFQLDKGDETELEAAKNTYLEYQTEYQKKLIGKDYNYDKEELAIESARLDYKKAVRALNTVIKNKKEAVIKTKKLNSVNKKIAALEKSIAEYEQNIAALGDVDEKAAHDDLEAKKRTLTTLKNELGDIDADIVTLKESGASQAEITEKERMRRDKAVEVNNMQADVNAASEAVTSAAAGADKIKNYNAQKGKYSRELEEYQAKQAKLTARLEVLNASMSKEEAQEQVTEKEIAWNNLIADYEIKKSEDSYNKQTDDIDLKAAKDKLESQKKLVDELTDTIGKSEVTAQMAGIVSQISCMPGDSTQPDTPLAVISADDGCFTLKVSVTKEQAVKVKQGQSATLTNYWGSDGSAVLRSIEPDAEDSANRILCLEVKGEDIAEGDNISVSIGGESKEYDAIVSKNSIYEDNNGKFVLVITNKNTPLGTRYIATRRNIDILAEDDIRAAISMETYGNDYVITASSKAVEPGEQVKLKE